MLEIAQRQYSRNNALNNGEEKNLNSCSLAALILRHNLSHDTIHPLRCIKGDLVAQESLSFKWLHYVIMHFHTGTAQYSLQTSTIQLNWNSDSKYGLEQALMRSG